MCVLIVGSQYILITFSVFCVHKPMWYKQIRMYNQLATQNEGLTFIKSVSSASVTPTSVTLQ